MKKLLVDIITPDRTVFNGEVDAITVPGTDGQFQVLFNHAPLISTLDKGEIRLKMDAGEKRYSSEGGVIEVLKNKVIVLVERISDN